MRYPSMNERSRFEDTLTTCFWLCKLTATQSKTYLGRVSNSSGGEPYIKKAIEGGRRSLPHRGHETAEVAPVLDKGFEDGAVHVAIHRRRYSVMPWISTERVRKLAYGSVVVRLHPC